MIAITGERFSVAGARLAVLTAGTGEPVVLLHGVPTGAELFRDLLAGLATAGLRALAPDLPGFGATRLPAGADHSLAATARLLASWLRAADLAPAWVVGHDLGGAVAQLLAAEYPDVVARLTLTNSVVDGCWPAPRARFAILAARARLFAPAAHLRLVPNPFLRWEIRRAFADPARASRAAQDRICWDGKFRDPDGRTAFGRYLAALDPADTARVVPALSGLHIPCQLVWGMADPFQPFAVAGTRLAALLPQPQVTQLERCGHFTPWECPDRLLAAMLDWSRATPLVPRPGSGPEPAPEPRPGSGPEPPPAPRPVAEPGTAPAPGPGGATR